MARRSTPEAAARGTADGRLPPDARGGLRRIAARGTIVNAAFVVGLDTLTLLRGFIVAALLTASEFGVWTVLVITIGTLGLLKDGIVGDKYVQQDDADQERAFQRAFTFEAILNGVLAAVIVIALPLFALAYGESKIIAPGFALLIAIPAATLQSPLWIFYRQMRFLKQRTVQAVDVVTAFVVTITLAVLGAGYWSIVIGAIAGRVVSAAVAVRVSPYRLGFVFERGAVRDYVSFGGPLFAAAASRVFGVQVLIFAGEAKLGLAGVGMIGLASTIRSYGDRVDAIVTQTLYPVICAVRDRNDLLFEAFVKSNRLGLMWGVPFGIGLALFAPDLVEFAYGPEWRPAIGLIQAFGAIAAFNHIAYNWTAFFRARGETGPIGVVAGVSLLAMLGIVVPLLLIDGLQGLALGLAIATAVSLTARTWYLSRLFPSFQILWHSARAIAPTVPAALAILGLRAATEIERSLLLAFAELALYLALAAAATFLLERPLLREAVGYLRRGSTPAA